MPASEPPASEPQPSEHDHRQRVRLGFVLHGVGRNWGDWRHPDMPVDASTSLSFYRGQAGVAERGLFDFLFVADGLHADAKTGPHYMNRFEPLTILSALAAVTCKIGLVGTASTTYTEPFNLARQFASLDHISGGRAGWNMVTTMVSAAAANFGRASHLPHGDRYRMAAEYAHVVNALWDSWQDDALVADKAAGTFFDPDKVNPIDHDGEFFRVRGPLNIRRSPQGRPVLFQAGASPEGKAFAVSHADAIFVSHDRLDKAQAYYAECAAAAARAGRPEKPLIYTSAIPVIVPDGGDIAKTLEEVQAYVTMDDAMAMLRWRLDGTDISSLQPGDPFPAELASTGPSRLSIVEEVMAEARRDGLTVGEVALRLSMPPAAFCGTASEVAAAMIEWVEQKGVDGFIVYESLPGQLDLLVDLVVPELQRREAYHAEYPGTTLRDTLSLPRPSGRG